MKILLWGILTVLFIPLRGQQISGSVQNKNGEGIEFASIVLWQEAGTQMLDYTTADQYGKYALEIMEVRGMLVASSLGYKPDTVYLDTIPENHRSRVNFQLEANTFQLESVQVSDSRIPYKTEGDTVTYQSEFFSDGTEQVIEDLVKKLPGASVSEDGTIFYKGKQVDKVLLEDDELFGRRYTIGTRSLRADVVDEIQFIDHYVENPLLKEVQQSDQLAMNITIKEDRKKLLFGDASIAGGLPERYEVNANLFSLFKKNKAVIIANAENTAGSPLDMSTLFRDGFDLDAPYEYQRTAHNIVHILNNRPFELQKAVIKNGSIRQAATNLVLNPNEKLKIRSFGLGFGDRWDLEKRYFFRDLNLGKQYEYEDRNFFDEKNLGLEWNLETLWQISDRSNLKYSFNVSKNQVIDQAGTMLSSPKRDTISQFLENDSGGSIHRFNWVGKLANERVLVVDASYLRQQKDQDFYFEKSNDQEEHFSQKNEHIIKDADLLASLLGKSGSLKYALSLKYRLQTDRLEVSPSDNDLLSRELKFMDYFLNEYRQQFLAMIGSFSTFLGNAKFFSKLELGYRDARWNTAGEPANINHEFYPNFQSGVEIPLTKKSTLLLSGAVKSTAPGMRHLISGPVWTSYRSLFQGTDQIDPYLNFSGVILFAHSNNAKLLEASANMMYTNNSRAFLDRYFYDGIFGVRKREILNGGDRWSLNGNLDKYLPGLFANLGVHVYSAADRSLVISSAENPNKVMLWTNSVELSYTTVFDGPLNFGVSGERNWNSYRQWQSGYPVKSINQRSSINYLVTFKPFSKWYLKVTTQQLLTNNQSQKAKTLYLGMLRSEYLAGNGFRLGVQVYNLWNTRIYNLENLTAESYNFQSWVLNPRIFLLNIGFRF